MRLAKQLVCIVTTQWQVEVVSRSCEEMQMHGKDLKCRQDVVFSDPMKRSSPFSRTIKSITVMFFLPCLRFYNVYKHLDFHIKQREQKLQVIG